MISSTLRSATRTLTRDRTFLNDQFTKLACLSLCNVRDIHVTSNLTKQFRIGKIKVRPSAVKGGTRSEGEQINEIRGSSSTSMFPNILTQNALYYGIPYNQLHIVNVKSTFNNTIISLTDYAGKGILTHSAGCEGFKNAKKGTSIAAQQTALTLGHRAIERGVPAVRLRVQGIGPGRMGALKGIELSGMKVVSITDDTRVSWNPLRAKKQRRI